MTLILVLLLVLVLAVIGLELQMIKVERKLLGKTDSIDRRVSMLEKNKNKRHTLNSKGNKNGNVRKTRQQSK